MQPIKKGEPTQQILLCSCLELIEELKSQVVRGRPPITLVMADPPWKYQNYSEAKQGAAASQYAGVSVYDIAGHLSESWQVAAQDAYLLVWCTWPKLEEWIIGSHLMLKNCSTRVRPPGELEGWLNVSGGSWHKSGQMGVGHHWRGDSEPVLLYKKGSPAPRTHASNSWVAPRGGHSEKPQLALRRQVAMMTDPGDLVLDLYAGESASLARACRALGRSYVGAEIDKVRHRKALEAFGAQELELECYPPELPKDNRQSVLIPSEAEGGALVWDKMQPGMPKLAKAKSKILKIREDIS